MEAGDKEAQNEFEKKLSEFTRRSSVFTRKLIVPGRKVTILTLDSGARPYSSGTYLDLCAKGIDVEDINSLPEVFTEDIIFRDYKDVIEGKNVLGIDVADKNRFLIRENIDGKKDELGYEYFIYCNVLPFRFEWFDSNDISNRTEKYSKEIVPWAKKYFGKDRGIIISVPPLGTLYANETLNQLKDKGCDVDYRVVKGSGSVKPDDLADKKVLIIDSISIPEAEELLERIEGLKDRYGIKDIRFAVEYDPQEAADWSIYPPHTSPPESEGSIFSKLRKFKPKL